MSNKKTSKRSGFSFLELQKLINKGDENFSSPYEWDNSPDAPYWKHPPFIPEKQKNETEEHYRLECLEYELIAKWAYRGGLEASEMEPDWEKEKQAEAENLKQRSGNIKKIRANRHRANGGKFFNDFDAKNDSLREALEKVKKFHSCGERFILIMGKVGTGKTHLLSSLAYEHNYYQLKSIQLYPAIMEMKFPNMNHDTLTLPDKPLRDFIKLNLAIDDAGSETVDNKGHLQDGIKTIIEYGNKKIAITTNLNIKDLMIKYGEKNVSRILEDCVIVKIKSSDYRIKETGFDSLRQMTLDESGGPNGQ